MRNFSRREKHDLLFRQMKEKGTRKTSLYLYEAEIFKLLSEDFSVVPYAVHPLNKNLFLCEITLPETP